MFHYFVDSYDLDQDLKLAQETTVLVESYTVSDLFQVVWFLSATLLLLFFFRKPAKCPSIFTLSNHIILTPMFSLYGNSSLMVELLRSALRDSRHQSACSSHT